MFGRTMMMDNRALMTIVTIAFALPLPAQEPTPTSIELPQSMVCGTDVKGKVNLSGPVTTDRLAVDLTSSQPATIAVASPAGANKGATFANFEVTCRQGTQSMPVTITARANGGTASGTLQVLAPVLQTLSVQPHTGGASVQGQATLIGRAPLGGVVVALSSSSNSATVPQSVTVRAGDLSAPFTVTTRVVSQPTTVSILGTGFGVSKTVDLVLQPPVPTNVTVHHWRGDLISSGTVVGGAETTIKVTLSSQPRPGHTVSLMSNNPGLVAVPATVTFDGSSAEHSFKVTPGTVSQRTTVNIVATVAGTSATGALHVLPPSIEDVSVAPSTATGGQTVQFRVRLNGEAPAAGFAGDITTNNPDAVTISRGFRVPAGDREVSIPMQASRLDESATATITAGANGLKRNAILKVEPEGPTSISLQSTPIIGGSKNIATVTRVPSPEPMTVLLASDNDAVKVPASVTFGPNSASERVTITTEPVPSQTFLRITAKKGAVTKSAGLQLNPPAVTQLTLSPSTMTGGQNFTVQFTLNGRAAAGLVVKVTTLVSGMSFPRDVAVPVNSTTGSVTVYAATVTRETRIHVTAATSSGSQSAFLTVNPQ